MIWKMNKRKQDLPQSAALFTRGGTGTSSSDFFMLLMMHNNKRVSICPTKKEKSYFFDPWEDLMITELIYVRNTIFFSTSLAGNMMSVLPTNFIEKCA